MPAIDIQQDLWSLVGCLTQEADCIEFRSLPGKTGVASFIVRATEADIADAVERMSDGRNQNWCWGPCPRDVDPDCEELAEIPEVALARCLYVDVDTDPYTGDKGCTVEAAMRFLFEQGVMPPTAIVNSGHGVHLYWALTAPITVESEWKRAQGWLRDRLKADKAVSDWKRVMRVPGFLNHKPERGDPVPCELVHIDTDATYDLNDVVVAVSDLPIEPSYASTRPDHGLGLTPWEEYQQRGDLVGDLVKAGWTLMDRMVHSKSGGPQQMLRRPGKSAGNGSATFNGSVLYVFTDGAPGFEPRRGYGKFEAYVRAIHGGNTKAAVRDLRLRGFVGTDVTPAANRQVVEVVDINTGEVTMSVEDGSETTLADFLRTTGDVAECVIPGLLRRGEVMNLVGSPKTRKSFLAMQIALSVATGANLFDLLPKCDPAGVMIFDNELTAGVLKDRFQKVCRDMRIAPGGLNVLIECSRGKGTDLKRLVPRLKDRLVGRGIKLIILDAFYKLLPRGYDENDNAMMTELFNELDSLATAVDAAVIVIHHTSKGSQFHKSVTDMGSGAGSMSRAADTHAVLRKHQDDDCVVLEAAVRSFEPFKPKGLRFNGFKAVYDEHIDVKRLDGARQKDLDKADEEVPCDKKWDQFQSVLRSKNEKFNFHKRNKTALASTLVRLKIVSSGRRGKDLVEQWIMGGVLPECWSD